MSAVKEYFPGLHILRSCEDIQSNRLYQPGMAKLSQIGRLRFLSFCAFEQGPLYPHVLIGELCLLQKRLHAVIVMDCVVR
jgi:hypothetical protein